LHAPYHIVHLHLHETITPPAQATSMTAQYVICWWKQVPIGEFFIEQHEQVPETAHTARLLAAISPAIDQYALQQGVHPGNYKTALLACDHAAFSDIMETVFATYTPTNIPGKTDVSVVICTRDRPVHISRCLQALGQLSCVPAEIIVVDNAPKNDETKKVVAQFPGVRYHHEPRPGLDIARNAGVRLATAPVVAFVDDDVTVHPHCIYWIWKTFRDEGVSAMTGLVLAASLDTEAQVLFEKQWRFNRGYRDQVYDTAFFNRTIAHGTPVWIIGAGANMAFRKSIFSETGYFDERLDVGAAGCNGDSELWFRILAKGHSIAYNPRAVVWHEHRRDMQGLRRQLYGYMRGFTVAALIQQRMHSAAGYKRHLFLRLPKWYLGLLVKGFPAYRSRYATIFTEMKGMLSGIAYYLKHKKQQPY
jgi:glycosyltransferase involved in cell wall biosynthesis